MKLIIAGGRDFDNPQLMEDEIAKLDIDITEVVCGEARGADTLGADWANRNGIPVSYFPAHWDVFGKAAGFVRNRMMGEYADYLIAFWDGKSHGTKNMIDYMKKLNKPGRVVMYEK